MFIRTSRIGLREKGARARTFRVGKQDISNHMQPRACAHTRTHARYNCCLFSVSCVTAFPPAMPHGCSRLTQSLTRCLHSCPPAAYQRLERERQQQQQQHQQGKHLYPQSVPPLNNMSVAPKICFLGLMPWSSTAMCGPSLPCLTDKHWGTQPQPLSGQVLSLLSFRSKPGRGLLHCAVLLGIAWCARARVLNRINLEMPQKFARLPPILCSVAKVSACCLNLSLLPCSCFECGAAGGRAAATPATGAGAAARRAPRAARSVLHELFSASFLCKFRLS